MTRGRRVALLAATVAVLAAGCSVSGGTGKPPSVPPGATYGGVLRVGIAAPGGIDPIDAYEPNGELVSETMCDTLLALDPVTGQLQGAIASSWEQQGDFFTIKLRSGVTFSNGRRVRTSDINGSLEDLVAPDNASYVADYALDLLGARTAESATDALLGTGVKHTTIASRVGHSAVQVESLGPAGGTLRAFAEPAMAPVSQVAYTADPTGFADAPVCVGPYALATPYVPGDKLIKLVRYPGYYAKNVAYTGGGKGYPDEIDFSIYPTDAAALTAYLHGQVDVVRVPDDQLSRVTGSALGDVVYGPATSAEYLGLPDGQDGPLADRNVRIALSEALDRTLLARMIFGTSAVPANGFLPPALSIAAGPSLGGRTAKAAPLQTCGALTPATPDLSAARAALAKATTPLTGTITLTVNDDAPYPAMAREVAREWGALGLDVNVVTMPWDAYLDEATNGGLTSAFRIRWSTNATAPIAVYNDQESYLAPLLSSGATLAGNWAHWNDNDFDFDLISDAAGVDNVQQRGIAFASLAKLACEQMPIIPAVFDRPAYLIRSETVGSARAVPIGRDGLVLLRELYLK